MDLPGRWRQEAEVLRLRYRDERLAYFCEVHAQELEDTLNKSDAEPMSLRQAAEVSGYSVPHLRRLMDSDILTNVGDPGRPRVLLGELPFKPGRAAGVAARLAAEDARARLRVTRPVARKL
jgi:hypothetical protein